MPPASDPYRTLGLPVGAPPDAIKRAYRRLAKANHPDTAGPAAIPRFLAIQAAYETLVGSSAGEAGPTRGARPGWEADPKPGRTTRESWQSRAGRPPGARGTSGADPGPAGDGASGAARDDGQSAGQRRRRPAGPGRRATGPQRPPDRATPGSTSYDFADEPFDPDWSGASWYGQSSGTYWTINPKEYADPRKHGPEYQARARRNGPGVEPAANGASESTSESAATADTAPQPPPPPEHAPREPAARTAPPPPPAAERAAPRPRVVPPNPRPAPGDARARPTSGPEPAPGDAFDPLILLRLGAFARSRLALALVAWPPIGIGLAIVLGEATGCGRFAATCVDSFELTMWLGQLAIIAVLLILPVLAAPAAVATLVTLAAAAPIAILLSAAGGSRDPASAGMVLGVALALAWVCGLVVALVRRSRTVPP